MRNALIFHGTIICVLSLPVFGLRGIQTRRVRDEMEAKRVEDQTVVGLSSRDEVKVPEESKET